MYTTAVTTYITPLITPEKVRCAILASLREPLVGLSSSQSSASNLEGLAELANAADTYARVSGYATHTRRGWHRMCVHVSARSRVCVRATRRCVDTRACMNVCDCVRWLGACVWVELDRGRHPSDRGGPTNRGVGYFLPLCLSVSHPRLPPLPLLLLPSLPLPSFSHSISPGSSCPCALLATMCSDRNVSRR